MNFYKLTWEGGVGLVAVLARAPSSIVGGGEPSSERGWVGLPCCMGDWVGLPPYVGVGECVGLEPSRASGDSSSQSSLVSGKLSSERVRVRVGCSPAPRGGRRCHE